MSSHEFINHHISTLLNLLYAMRYFNYVTRNADIAIFSPSNVRLRLSLENERDLLNGMFYILKTQFIKNIVGIQNLDSRKTEVLLSIEILKNALKKHFHVQFPH